MNPGNARVWLVLAAAIILAGAGAFIGGAVAEDGSSASQSAKSAKEPQKDYYQRSLEIYEFRKAARSGVARGEEIFYYKCWFCHNEYTKDGVILKGLYSRSKLSSG